MELWGFIRMRSGQFTINRIKIHEIGFAWMRIDIKTHDIINYITTLFLFNKEMKNKILTDLQKYGKMYACCSCYMLLRMVKHYSNITTDNIVMVLIQRPY